MTKLKTKLQSEPIAWQVTLRVNQLISYYGRDSIAECIYFGIGDDLEQGLHVKNLLLTYGTASVLKVCENIFPKSEVA